MSVGKQGVHLSPDTAAAQSDYQAPTHYTGMV